MSTEWEDFNARFAAYKARQDAAFAVESRRALMEDVRLCIGSEPISDVLGWAFAAGECLAVLRYDHGEDFAIGVQDAFRDAQFRPAPSLKYREIEDMTDEDDGVERSLLATGLLDHQITIGDVLYLFRVMARYSDALDNQA